MEQFLHSSRVPTIFKIKKIGLFKDDQDLPIGLPIGTFILLSRRVKRDSDLPIDYDPIDEQSDLAPYDDGDINIITSYYGYFAGSPREDSLQIIPGFIVSDSDLREYTEIIGRWVQAGNRRGNPTGNTQSGTNQLRL